MSSAKVIDDGCNSPLVGLASLTSDKKNEQLSIQAWNKFDLLTLLSLLILYGNFHLIDSRHLISWRSLPRFSRDAPKIGSLEKRCQEQEDTQFIFPPVKFILSIYGCLGYRIVIIFNSFPDLMPHPHLPSTIILSFIKSNHSVQMTMLVFLAFISYHKKKSLVTRSIREEVIHHTPVSKNSSNRISSWGCTR